MQPLLEVSSQRFIPGKNVHFIKKSNKNQVSLQSMEALRRIQSRSSSKKKKRKKKKRTHATHHTKMKLVSMQKCTITLMKKLNKVFCFCTSFFFVWITSYIILDGLHVLEVGCVQLALCCQYSVYLCLFLQIHKINKSKLMQ